MEAVQPLEMRCSKQTDPKSLGGAIAYTLLKQPVVLRAVGQQAVFAANKALCVAQGHVRSAGGNLLVEPTFFQISEKEGVSYSGISYLITKVG